MTPKITPELREAIRSVDGPLPIHDEVTNKTYFVGDSQTMATLKRQDELAAIHAGLDDVVAGRVSAIDESIARIRRQLGFPDWQ